MLAENDFNRLRQLLYDTCWIDLHDNKKELVMARLSKRLRQLGITDYGQYVSRVLSDKSGEELTELINMLTTNLTFFFREKDHLEFLSDHITRALETGRRNERPIKIWSAGCSSGEEPYSIAIHLRETLPNPDHPGIAVLATDISAKMVEIAREGVYPESRFKDIPSLLRDRYFQMISTEKSSKGSEKMYKARPALSSMIRFARHNLAGEWPMKGPFDAVFCRNVMIYFDKRAQQQLVDRFYGILRSGGVLIVGHTESLTGIKHGFEYVRPSVYLKHGN